ncbi:McrC family protein [Bacillus toyonensis]|uniref:McrC family protein n=1 Tax=Bacillus toyonensis TaxID=155322 RepID=UPI00103DFCDB|nr:McrC family protein [Bacillus toyonensis]MCU5303205.1 McrC family protein [Bacillus toyonensis]TBX46479.1 restriction endonuclease [Bacillus toyonensis]
MQKLLEVREYDSITCNKGLQDNSQYKYLDEESFNQLEDLILSFSNEKEIDVANFFSLGSKRNVGKIICIKNYVGIVQVKNGMQIQVLPKIDLGDIADTKRIFLRMIKSMKDFPSKVFNDTNLNIEQMSLYEIFINLYTQEVRNLVKKGLKSTYYSEETNSNFYKGKLALNEHIRKNIVHRDRFYVSFDEFGLNSAENKLIKATLLKLMKISSSSENIRGMRQLLTNFELINASINYEKDFNKVIINRNNKEYEVLMQWSKVFLLNRSFTTFSGNSSGRALLFPMEKVFEAYVGRSLKKALADTNWNVSLQDRGYYLFERKFALKPDIVIKRNDTSRKIILDTKWKALYNNPRSNYGIVQADMYQMYAYAKKYNTNEIWMLYPINDEMINVENVEFKSDDNVVVKVFFVDVSNINESINDLIGLWDKCE